MQQERGHAARRIGTLLQPATGFDKAPDEFVGLVVADPRALELLFVVALVELVIGVIGDRAHCARQNGLRIGEDFVFARAEALGARRQGTQPFGDGRRPGDAMLHHGIDDPTEVFGLIIGIGDFLIDQSAQAIGITARADRGSSCSHRPNIIRSADAGLGGADTVHAVGGDRKAVRSTTILTSSSGKFVDLDGVDANLLLAAHAPFFRRGDDNVAAVGAPVGASVATRSADGTARHPDARTADFQFRSPLLPRSTGRLKDLMVTPWQCRDGDRAHQKILEMGVAVDEARQDRKPARR